MADKVSDQSKQRRSNNELIFKNLNVKTGRLIDKVFDERDKVDVPIEFYCECSDTNCVEKISLTLEIFFQRIRSHPTYFLVKPGHNQPDIDSIIEENSDYCVVEKHRPIRPLVT